MTILKKPTPLRPDDPVTVQALVQLLQPLMRAAVQEALAAVTPLPGELADQLSVGEARAAKLLDVGKYCIRDARKRGEIEYSTVGSRIVFEPQELQAYLRRHRNCGPRPRKRI